MSLQFPTYQVTVVVDEFLVIEGEIQACSSDKAIEIFYQNNTKQLTPNLFGYQTFVTCGGGIQFDKKVKVLPP